ncbi:peptidoglycan-binding protein [Streptomyces sp. NPDC058420]|uniref:peptidoglycan-binding protein n=1 Tax=Streptomyces sp. NPDC058420 TaxID=3346489 RepID=UPI00365FC53A
MTTHVYWVCDPCTAPMIFGSALETTVLLSVETNSASSSPLSAFSTFRRSAPTPPPDPTRSHHSLPCSYDGLQATRSLYATYSEVGSPYMAYGDGKQTRYGPIRLVRRDPPRRPDPRTDGELAEGVGAFTNGGGDIIVIGIAHRTPVPSEVRKRCRRSRRRGPEPARAPLCQRLGNTWQLGPDGPGSGRSEPLSFAPEEGAVFKGGGMARWRALPAGIDPAVAALVAHLRKAKDFSGLSIKQLASATGYSTSSWERYLSGRALPPPAAVRSLAEVVGADPVRLLALLDAAVNARRSGPFEPESPSVPTPPSEPVSPSQPVLPPEPATAGATAAGDDRPDTGVDGDRHHLAGWRQLGLLGCGMVVGAVMVLLLVQPTQVAAARSVSGTTAVAVPEATAFACAYTRQDGRWYAGNSETRTQQLVVDMTGPAVAELQCLLQRAGVTPGGIDGNFGPLTESAVIQAQKKFHLDVDGQVGPSTWAALRG